MHENHLQDLQIYTRKLLSTSKTSLSQKNSNHLVSVDMGKFPGVLLVKI